jgi:hypothetical protein
MSATFKKTSVPLPVNRNLLPLVAVGKIELSGEKVKAESGGYLAEFRKSEISN